MSDGTAGWQTGRTWLSAGDHGVGGWGGDAVTSKSPLHSAGALGYVTAILS